MIYHIFEIDNNYCMVNGDTADVYNLPKEVADKIMENGIDLKLIDEYFTKEGEQFKKVPSEKKQKCNRLTINVTNRCNLACRYCYANCGDYKQDSIPEIKIESVENAIRRTIELYPEGIGFIQLFGGEPLLLKKKLKTIVDCIKRICEEYNVPKPLFGMVTNGTLIDEETAYFLTENLSSLTISLDGNQTVNDFNRKYPGPDGHGVYQKVKEAVKLLKACKEDFQIKCECTVTAKNINDYIQNGKKDNLYYAIYEDIGFDGCLCNPVFGSDDPEISLDEIDLQIVLDYFDEFICREMYDKDGNLRNGFKMYRLLRILKKNYLNNQCGANEADLAVDVSGDLYPCFMFIGTEEYKIVNVNDCKSVDIKKRYAEIMKKLEGANDNEICAKCWAKRFCSLTCGNCIGARYLANGTIKKPITRSCEIGKKLLERSLWEAVRYTKQR